METESIYDASSSEFDSLVDDSVFDSEVTRVTSETDSSAAPDSDPAEQEQELEEQKLPEQEEQGSADSSEPDSDPCTESVYYTDFVTESSYDESSDFDSVSDSYQESEDAVTVLVSQPDFSPVVEELQRIEGIGITLLLSIAFAAAFVIAYWFFRIWNYFTRF